YTTLFRSTNSSGTVLGTSTVGGNLTVTAATGSITELEPITTGASDSSFTTSTLGQSIDLGTQANNFTNTVSFSTSGQTGDVTYRNAGAIVFPATTIGGK